jgi:protein-S-isoprenylcysteine O-methyltransferase Ste14
MQQPTEITINDLSGNDTGGLARRSLVLIYGLCAYLIGVGGLLWFILAMGGLAPVGFGPLQTDGWMAALAVDFALILLFGLQHSVMARDGCKRWLVKHIPAAAERSTFVLASGILSLLALALWQPLPGTVWAVENSLGKSLLWACYGLGWGYLFAATFVTNHFELMGLRQVYLHFANRPYRPLPFVRKYMYRYSRHPMMLGLLVGIWALPVMSVSQFAMACLFSVYLAVGLIFEERDLLRTFGDAYRVYRDEIAALIPRMY